MQRMQHMQQSVQDAVPQRLLPAGHIAIQADRGAAAGVAPGIAIASPLPPNRQALLMQVQRYIADHLQQASLAPAEILRVFPVSRPTLYRLFEGSGGLATYIRHRRLHEAARILLTSPLRVIVEVAYCVGFASASDFTRAFRRYYGVTPSAYRQLQLSSIEADTDADGPAQADANC